MSDSQFYPEGQLMPQSHGSLVGLSGDDHTQYFNETRGDARYYTETEVDGLLDGLEAAASSDVAVTATGTPGETYTTAEQGMIAALIADVATLRDSLNDLKGKMRTAGTLETPA